MTLPHLINNIKNQHDHFKYQKPLACIVCNRNCNNCGIDRNSQTFEEYMKSQLRLKQSFEKPQRKRRTAKNGVDNNNRNDQDWVIGKRQRMESPTQNSTIIPLSFDDIKSEFGYVFSDGIENMFGYESGNTSTASSLSSSTASQAQGNCEGRALLLKVSQFQYRISYICMIKYIIVVVFGES